jgi:hypothetical protein
VLAAGALTLSGPSAADLNAIIPMGREVRLAGGNLGYLFDGDGTGNVETFQIDDSVVVDQNATITLGRAGL